MNPSINKLRLVCKLSGRAEVRDEELLSELLSEKWRVEGRNAELDGSIVKLLSLNPSRDEFMLILNLKKHEHLDNLIKSIIRKCWYIDIYYNFKGDEAERVAEYLKIGFDERRDIKLKLLGVNLKVSIYPSIKALTISYRVGWAEVSKNIVSRIHGKICGTSKPSIISKIMGWRR